MVSTAWNFQPHIRHSPINCIHTPVRAGCGWRGLVVWCPLIACELFRQYAHGQRRSRRKFTVCMHFIRTHANVFTCECMSIVALHVCAFWAALFFDTQNQLHDWCQPLGLRLQLAAICKSVGYVSCSITVENETRARSFGVTAKLAVYKKKRGSLIRQTKNAFSAFRSSCGIFRQDYTNCQLIAAHRNNAPATFYNGHQNASHVLATRRWSIDVQTDYGMSPQLFTLLGCKFRSDPSHPIHNGLCGDVCLFVWLLRRCIHVVMNFTWIIQKDDPYACVWMLGHICWLTMKCTSFVDTFMFCVCVFNSCW